MPPPRLSRKEQQARTRDELMEAAVRVLSRRGLDGGSVEEIAAEAGYTKGAFYANFASKEELFLAMLDRRFAERVKEVDRLVGGSEEDVENAVRDAGDEFSRYVASDPEWQRLFFEFAGRAARDEHFRVELVARYRALRDRIADAYVQRVGEFGIEPPLPPDEVALMTFAMGNGVALEKLLEPDAVPDELYGTMLAIFFRGLRALAEDAQASAPAAAR